MRARRLSRGRSVRAAPASIASDGDRDGLPNVLMEAQIMGLPVAATRMAAIPELIVEGETGVLVVPATRPPWRKPSRP